MVRLIVENTNEYHVVREEKSSEDNLLLQFESKLNEDECQIIKEQGKVRLIQNSLSPSDEENDKVLLFFEEISSGIEKVIHSDWDVLERIFVVSDPETSFVWTILKYSYAHQGREAMRRSLRDGLICLLCSEITGDKFILSEQEFELPSCGSCLIKIDCKFSYLPTWPSSKYSTNSNCQICFANKKKPKCETCDADSDIWVCLICGKIGCGRYVATHSFYHFLQSGHRFSICTQTENLWDYVNDAFAHNVESSEKLETNIESNFDNIFQETKDYYDRVIQDQLNAQKQFYEQKLKNECLEVNQTIAEFDFKIKDYKKRLDEVCSEEERLKLELSKSHNAKSKFEQKLKGVQESIDNFTQDIKLMENKSSNQNNSEQEKKLEGRIESTKNLIKAIEGKIEKALSSLT